MGVRGSEPEGQVLSDPDLVLILLKGEEQIRFGAGGGGSLERWDSHPDIEWSGGTSPAALPHSEP